MAPSEPKIKCSLVNPFVGLLPYGPTDTPRVVLQIIDVLEDGTTEDRWLGLSARRARELSLDLLERSYELEAFLAKQPKQEVADGPA